jgi:hypothetical protein
MFLSSRNNLVSVVLPLLQAIQKETGGYFQVFAGWPKDTPPPGEEQAFGVKLCVDFSFLPTRVTIKHSLAFLLEQRTLGAKLGANRTKACSRTSLPDNS